MIFCARAIIRDGEFSSAASGAGSEGLIWSASAPTSLDLEDASEEKADKDSLFIFFFSPSDGEEELLELSNELNLKLTIFDDVERLEVVEV